MIIISMMFLKMLFDGGFRAHNNNILFKKFSQEMESDKNCVHG